MKKLFIILIAPLFMACFGGFGDPVDNSQWGDIEGRVLNIIDGTPVENVDVRIGDLRDSSDESGFFSVKLDMVDEYGNNYRLDHMNYKTHTGSIVFGYGQKNIVSYICPLPASNNGDFIFGVVSDGTNTIDEAKIEISGIGYRESVESVSRGQYNSKENIKLKYISINVYKDGYESYRKSVALDIGKYNIDCILKEKSGVEYASLKGVVTGYGGAYAKVSFGDYYVIADNNGGFEMRGIPVGTQNIKVRPTGFFEEKVVEVEIASGDNDLGDIVINSIKGD